MEIKNLNVQYSQPLIPLILSNVQYIILHHAEAVSATPEQVHQWHLANKWAGFGYNEYIRKDGTVYIGRGDHIGAQCAGMNSKSYGICCEGNYDVETKMPDAQKKALIERIRVNRRRFVNCKGVFPHSIFFATQCPGKYFPIAEIINESEEISVDINEALRILVEKGVIKNPEYWLKAAQVVMWLDQLLINFAIKIK